RDRDGRPGLARLQGGFTRAGELPVGLEAPRPSRRQRIAERRVAIACNPDAAYSRATTPRRRQGVNIGESRVGDHLVLRPVGRLDTQTTAEFQARLLQLVTAGPDDVHVDFAQV